MRGMSWEGNAEGEMSLLTCIVGLGSRSRCLCVGPFLNTVGKYVGATVMGIKSGFSSLFLSLSLQNGTAILLTYYKGVLFATNIGIERVR